MKITKERLEQIIREETIQARFEKKQEECAKLSGEKKEKCEEELDELEDEAVKGLI